MPFHPLLLTATALALLCLFALAELAASRGMSREVTRRAVHMAGAAAVVTFPLYLSLADVAVLALIFTGFLVWTRLTGALASVHGVDRPTLGALLFPASLLFACAITWHRPLAVAYAALVLALADPLAAVVGRAVRSPSWPVPGGRKSLAGALTFALTTLLLGLSLGLLSGDIRPAAALAAGIVLAGVEAALGYGLDNLPLPILAGVLGRTWLGL